MSSIKSILDTDFYKLTMQYAVFNKFPNSYGTYKFKSRKSAPINKDFIDLFNSELKDMSNLVLSCQEQKFLDNLNLFSPQYLAFLRNFRFNPICVESDFSSMNLASSTIKIKGPWVNNILWEVPILSLISYCYFKTVDTNWSMDGQEEKASWKGNFLSENGCKFSDFGTRRRRNFETQEIVVQKMKDCPTFLGTSNVYLAMKYGVNPIGTMAHEWVMAHAGLCSLNHANYYAAKNWKDVYGDKLSVMLTDTYGTQAMCDDFDHQMTAAFAAYRHDSSCPYAFTEKIINHYNNRNFPQDYPKSIVYSDSLDVHKAVALHKNAFNYNNLSTMMGIGTHFTNDFDNSPALNIVMKLTDIRASIDDKKINIVKLSDEPSKAMGESNAVAIAKHIYFGDDIY